MVRTLGTLYQKIETHHSREKNIRPLRQIIMQENVKLQKLK